MTSPPVSPTISSRLSLLPPIISPRYTISSFKDILFIMSDQPESLLSPKNSDSGLHIQLHPLILLTISDHITRHAARSQQGPIVGALLGQQNGREITLEHVFECIVNEGPNGDLQIPQDWFVERVKQCKSRPLVSQPSTCIWALTPSKSKMYTKLLPLTLSAGGQLLPRPAPTPSTSQSIARSSTTTTSPPCSSRSTHPWYKMHPPTAASSL